jgi:hypothetical protein
MYKVCIFVVVIVNIIVVVIVIVVVIIIVIIIIITTTTNDRVFVNVSFIWGSKNWRTSTRQTHTSTD